MWHMQQNELEKLISEMEKDENHDINTLLGLKAEYQGNMEAALSYYYLSSNPTALTRSLMLLSRGFSSQRPIPQHIHGVVAPIAQRSPEQTVPPSYDEIQKSKSPPHPTTIQSAKTSARIALKTTFTAKDVTQCISKLELDDITFLIKLEIERKGNARISKQGFSQKIGITFEKVEVHNRKLRNLSLLGKKWPAVYELGKAVLEAFKEAKLLNSSNIPEIEQNMETLHQFKLQSDFEINKDDETVLRKLLELKEIKTVFAKSISFSRERLDNTIRRLQNRSLLVGWPDLTPFGIAVAKKLANVPSEIDPNAKLSQTYLPLQQSLQQGTPSKPTHTESERNTNKPKSLKSLC